MNGRVVSRQAAVAAAWLVLAGCAGMPGRSLPPNVEAVGERAYLFRAGNQRSLFLVGDDGVIVTDPINAAVAADYRAAIAALTRQPVRYVVYSHYHWDRVSGARLFQQDGAKIVAQERCAERFRVNPNPEVVMPDVTFTDRYTVSVGGASLDLYYFGPSHGDCLTVFVARPAAIMQVVELVNPPHAAFPRDPNVPHVRPHNLRQFFRATEELAASENIRAVLASSARVTTDESGRQQLSAATAPVSIIADQAKFWDAIYATVEYAESIGAVGSDSFVRLSKVDITPFKAFDGYNEQDLPVIMRRFVGFHDMGR